MQVNAVISALPIQVWALIVSVLAAMVQQMSNRQRRLEVRSKTLGRGEEEETVFVCLVGTSAMPLRALASAVRSSSSNPRALSFGIVVVVTSADRVERELGISGRSRTGSLFRGGREAEGEEEGVSCVWMYAKHPKKALVQARRKAIQTLYNEEKYVLFLHGSRTLDGWDDKCLRLLRREERRHKRRIVITSVPIRGDDDEAMGAAQALFPRLHMDGTSKVAIRPHPMAVTNELLLTPSTTWMRAFSFCERNTMRGCRDAFWKEGQLEQTCAFAERGIRVMTPCVAVASRASSMGVGAGTPAADAEVRLGDVKSFGLHPLAGLVTDEDEEKIIKFGNVDVANVLIEQMGAT